MERLIGRRGQTQWGVPVAERGEPVRKRRADAVLGPHATVGDRLRAARQGAHLTIRALATKTGTGQATIIRIERGFHLPRAATLRRIAEATGVSADWLLTGRDHDSDPTPPPAVPEVLRPFPDPLAARLVETSGGPDAAALTHRLAVERGRQGGLKGGGRARAERLSQEARQAIAQKAARAKWARRGGQAGGGVTMTTLDYVRRSGESEACPVSLPLSSQMDHRLDRARALDRLLNGGDKGGEPLRLCQTPDDVQAAARVMLLLEEARDDEHRQRLERRRGPEAHQNILAAQFGHVEVEQQEIGHDGAQRVQGLATRVRLEHPKARFRQGLRPELADEGVIVGDQDPLGRGPVLAHGLHAAHPVEQNLGARENDPGRG